MLEMVFKGTKSEKIPRHHGPGLHQKLTPPALFIQADGIKSYSGAPPFREFLDLPLPSWCI